MAFLAIQCAQPVAAPIRQSTAPTDLSQQSPQPLTPASLAQSDTFHLPSADSLLIDGLGQLYTWDARQTFTKLASLAEAPTATSPPLRYRNQRLGRLRSVDLTNPLRPVLFYADAQTVVYLDRNLAELRQLQLVSLNFGRIDAVAYAPNDGLWLFAPDRQRLYAIDRQAAIQQESPDLLQTFQVPIRAQALSASAKQVAMSTQDGRILLFGPFGAYRTQVLRQAAQLVAEETRLIFVDAGQWWLYELQYGQERLVESAQNGAKLLALRGEWALWRQGDRVWVAQY